MISKTTIIVDLGFGDSGKGTMVDFLARQSESTTVVRFNGGGQAAHNVVLPDGTHHCFSHFGSGTLAGARTHLSHYMLINPLAMFNEASSLGAKIGVDPFKLTTVDPNCVIVTPWHLEANRARERRRSKRHGTCGVGIGEAVEDMLHGRVLKVKDLFRSGLLNRLKEVQHRKRKQFPEIEAFDPDPQEVATLYEAILPRLTLRSHRSLEGDLVFEGAQGVLLDETFGCNPYCTWSKCTNHNAYEILVELDLVEPPTTIGVLRSFFVRHGLGPFPTENNAMKKLVNTDHNGHNLWQGSFRVGYFDAVLANYAISCCGSIDSLAITHLDKLASGMIATSRKNLWKGPSEYSSYNCEHYVDQISHLLSVPIRYKSYGPTYQHKEAI